MSESRTIAAFLIRVLGVFQTLVEKHFPAPDRSRIHRLLGLEPPSSVSKKAANGNDEGSSSGKRKSKDF